MIDVFETSPASGPPRQARKFLTLLALSLAVLIVPASAQIAAWDFFGESSSATSSADVFDVKLDSSNNITRGSGATNTSGGANNSFRTTGFQTNGIATSNTDYFVVTLSAATGYTLSLSTIDAKFAGTATYAASPGVSTQFAYSLDGTNFTLIGSAVSLIGTPVILPQISVAGISALQNVPPSTTITIRYYASGQTSTGGWGFTSVSAGDYGLKFGGTLTPSGPTDTTPPAVVSKTPADDSTTSIPTTDITITYDETILANSGTVALKKVSDNSTVDTITVPSAAVTVSGATATINPAVTLDYNTAYYVEVSAGAFKDFAGNPAPATGGSTVWNFTTRAAPQIVISQYHEGDGSTDRYVELKNLTGSPVSLTGYRLAVWSDSSPSDNEGWKSGTGTTDRVTSLDGFTIPANGYFLVAEAGPVAPGYAASNFDLTGNAGATAFNGDDSVVLYNGAGFATTEVVDAVSFSANQGEDKSFYRLTDQVGFDFSAGTSILNYAATWATKTVAEVNAATIAQAWYLRASVVSETLSLNITPGSFLESASATNAATATVTRTGPTTAALDVTISINDLSEASVQESIVTIPIGSASAQFPIGAVNDAFKDGDKAVIVTVTAPVFTPASQQITVLDDPADPAIPIVINEVESDSPGSDNAEFVELYNNSGQSVGLDGLVLVFYNGGDDTSYRAIDLTGTIPAHGCFTATGTAAAGPPHATFQLSWAFSANPACAALIDAKTCRRACGSSARIAAR